MNRVLAHTGVEYPIVQAPMGWIARSQLASAVSNAGGLGIIETSSGEVDQCLAEIARMSELTTSRSASTCRSCSSASRASSIWWPTSGVKFVTTSAGSPAKLLPHAQGGRPHRLSRRAQSRLGAEGGRRGRRRADRRRRRRRRLQESATMSPRSCSCRACARGPMCRSSPPAASATAAAWRRRLRWAPRASRWARASSAPPKVRCTGTTSRRSSIPTTPAR